MRKHANRRPSPALVVACIALAVSLSGTGYATVMQVSKNSVGTPQLKRNAVTAQKLSPNAVRAPHVLNGSLLVEDFKAGQIPAGPKGDKGDRGAAGPTEGTSSVDSNTALPASLTNQWAYSTEVLSSFTTSRAGRLLLLKGFNGHMICNPGALWWWIMLDNAIVRESVRFAAAASPNTPITLSAVTTDAVPAGQHTLAVGAMCFSGTPTGAGVSFYSGGSVVVLG